MREERNIIISSTGYFSKKKYNVCLVNFDDNKVYSITYDHEGKSQYEFIKKLSSKQRSDLLNYISENDLLNISINNVVYDASDIIEINFDGKKNVIRNASKEFTHNEMHIFDDIVNIVFNENPLEKIRSFFGMNLNIDKIVAEFAKKHSYKGAKYIGDWKEYKVYEPYTNDQQVSYVGLPLVILVNDKGEIRMSTSDEAMEILDDSSVIQSNGELSFFTAQEAVDAYVNKFGSFPFVGGLSDEEVIEKIKNAIKNNEELHIDFDDNTSFIRKYKIEKNGQKYDEYKKIELHKCPTCDENLLIMGDNKANLTCPKCKKNYMLFGDAIFPLDGLSKQDINKLIDNIDDKLAILEKEEVEINNKIEKNFIDVSKYSILNKSIEELIEAKEKFLDDWQFLLFNVIDESWTMKSGIYRVHIHSIIDAILTRIDDNVSKQQSELLNQVGKCISNRNKEELVIIVDNMKKLSHK